MARKYHPNQIDFFEVPLEDIGVEVTEEDRLQEEAKKTKEIKEERPIPYGLQCPECGNSLKLRKVDLSNKKDKRRAWFCGQCGRQTFDEYGRR